MMIEQQTELLAEPKEVDVVAIERELATLWKEAGVSGSDAAAPIVRACALNFLVITDDERQLDPLAEMAGEVTVEHPARIFLIATGREAARPQLDAWISARCTLPAPGAKQVCCEQINLIASGTERQKIPSIVTSLLVPDVPTVVLWKSRVDAHDAVLKELTGIADRILMDSSDDASPVQSMVAWEGFLQADRHTTFGDLAWTHLTPWRSVVANAFNPPEMRAQLERISSLTLAYSSTVQPPHSGLSQALLFAAWMARKLGWTTIKPFSAKGAGSDVAELRSGEQTVRVSLVPVSARENFPGAIESVAVGTNTNATLTFAATAHAHCVRLTKRLDASTSDEMVTVMSDKSEAMLVAQELEVVRRDAEYESVLEKLMELLNA